MPEKRVAIIIVNYNGWEDTLECLESLEALSYRNFSVVVVDNHSPDPTNRERLRQYRAKHYSLDLLYLDRNTGFAGGNNAGISFAEKEDPHYLLLLNNDTIAEPDFLSKLVSAGESDKHFGILGPLILYPDGHIWFAGGKLNLWKAVGTHLGHGISMNVCRPPQAGNSHPRIVDYITGACLLIKKGVQREIGLLPEDYFIYYEDVAWNLEARRKGYRSVFVPDAAIVHKTSRSAHAGSPSYIYYHLRNGFQLVRNYGSLLQRGTAYCYSFWILTKQVLKLSIPSKRLRAQSALKGILDFYKGKRGEMDGTRI